MTTLKERKKKQREQNQKDMFEAYKLVIDNVKLRYPQVVTANPRSNYLKSRTGGGINRTTSFTYDGFLIGSIALLHTYSSSGFGTFWQLLIESGRDPESGGYRSQMSSIGNFRNGGQYTSDKSKALYIARSQIRPLHSEEIYEQALLDAESLNLTKLRHAKKKENIHFVVQYSDIERKYLVCAPEWVWKSLEGEVEDWWGTHLVVNRYNKFESLPDLIKLKYAILSLYGEETFLKDVGYFKPAHYAVILPDEKWIGNSRRVDWV